jgi:UDP-GlcNAc:undecaprenyl-phosphate/decaprenyl-phosphate GlcNAc-1-phosphate transferase
MLKYLVPFISSFLLSVLLMALVVYLAKKVKWQGRGSERHIHKKEVSRIGGMAMILAFNFAVLLNGDLVITPEICGIMLASLIILVFGLWDDMKEIYWKTQLFFQIAVSVLVFIFGIRIYYITNPFTGGIFSLDSGFSVIISIGLVIFWIVFVMDCINWSDGIDGLSGGIAFLSAVTIFFLSLKNEVNQPPVAILACILAGEVLGFLIFNFHPARIMAGTSGAFFMGFAVAILAIISGTKIATAILVLAIPIIDFFWVVGERIRNKRSIFRPDKRHLHYKLLKLGWSEKKIIFWYLGVTMLISFVDLNTRVIGKIITLAVSAIIMLLALVVINRKISKQIN